MSTSKCDMRCADPYDFAWCETHDETFPPGAVCSFRAVEIKADAIAARARGDRERERAALDALALDERTRKANR